MARKQLQPDYYFFSGDEEMNTTLDATAASDQTSSYPGIYPTEGVTRLTSTDHGFKVGALVYVEGTTNYDGLRKIVAVAANTLDIVAKFTAETPAGTETLRPALLFTYSWEFLGFKLHLAAASATTEDLVCSVDSDKGAAWDVNIYTRDMNGVQDRIYVPEETILIAPRDEVYFTWANTNDQLWGLEVMARRLA